MRHSQKRALALLIALLMALPTFAYAEEPGTGIVGAEIVDVCALIISDEVDPPVEEMEEIPLDDAETHDPNETIRIITERVASTTRLTMASVGHACAGHNGHRGRRGDRAGLYRLPAGRTRYRFLTPCIALRV